MNEETPMRKDNIWRRVIEPKLERPKLKWATFQVMRRTHASPSRQGGPDPKLVADQLGHGLGVNLDVYTVAGLDQRLAAVNILEQSLVSNAMN
jgi:integrase